MKTIFQLCLLAFALPTAGFAQTHTKSAELQLAAVGDAFDIGGIRFRIAPSASVRESGAPAGPDDVVVAGYVLEPNRIKRGRVKRSAEAGATAGVPNLAVAVSDDGLPTLVAPELNVYFEDISVVDALVRDTKGTLLYSSEVGGKAILGYPTVADTFAAMKRIQGRAGIKEVSPRIIDAFDEAE